MEAWLGAYPNLEAFSRDGAQTYASDFTNFHMNAIQVNDSFHLIKNLTDVVGTYPGGLFLSGLEIPFTSNSKSEKMQI